MIYNILCDCEKLPTIEESLINISNNLEGLLGVILIFGIVFLAIAFLKFFTRLN